MTRGPRRVWFLLLATAALLRVGPATGSVPSPSHVQIDRAIEGLRASLRHPDGREMASAPGWNALADRLAADLRAYAEAPRESERLAALGRLHTLWGGLRTTTWREAATLRDELRTWLEPRIRLAWAGRRLVETVNGLPPAPSDGARENRDRWTDFVRDDLNSALRGYEAARNGRERLDSLDRLHRALGSLENGNRSRPWRPALALQGAMDGLWDRPNLDATADANFLSGYLSQFIVMEGPVEYRGQISYVTPGPKTGFGLLPSDSGIAFYNSQMLTAITPIRGFEQQVAADPRGRRAARIFDFAATSRNDEQLTITANLSPSGLSLRPSHEHYNIDMNVRVDPEPGLGKAATRAVAALAGFNRGRIERETRENGLGPLQQQVREGAQAQSEEKIAQAMVEQNARLRAVLPGDGSLRAGPVIIDGLRLRSRPTWAGAGGTVRWATLPGQRGADMPEPSPFRTVEPGVNADVHLPSLLSNLAAGYMNRPESAFRTLLLKVHNVPPGEARPPVELVKDVSYSDFLRAADEAKATGDPKEAAIRVYRPGREPEFTVDAEGGLIAVVRDFAIEVSAPPDGALTNLFRGANEPPKAYRVTASSIEVALGFEVIPDAAAGGMRVRGQVKAAEFSPDAQVLALGDDDVQAVPANPFIRAGALAVFTNRLRGLPFDVSPGRLPAIPGGFALRSVSPLDPSGWLRLGVTRR